MHLFLTKNVFNSRYIVRNILALTILTVVIALGGGIVMIAGNGSSKNSAGQIASGNVEEVVALDGSVTYMEASGTNLIRADLEAQMTAGKEAKEKEIVAAAAASEFADKFAANRDDVNVRAEASTDADLVGHMNIGACGDVVAQADGWVQITSGDVQGYVNMPTVSAYNEISNPGGFMDVENPSGGYGNKNDYFLYADPNVEYRLILARFDTTTSPYQFKTVTTIDNVKSITFNVQKLNMSAERKYILQYTVTTVGTNIWDQATKKRVEYTMSSGVVLNNTNSSTPAISALTPGSNDTITMKSPSTVASSTCIRIRTSSRSEVDIS